MAGDEGSGEQAVVAKRDRVGGLILAFDPVAADATGLRIIEAIRQEFIKPLLPFL